MDPGKDRQEARRKEGLPETHLRFLFYTVYENVSIIRGQYDCFHFINKE